MYSSNFIWEKKVEPIPKPIVAANSKPIQADIGVNDKPVRKEESEFEGAGRTLFIVFLAGGLLFLFSYWLFKLGVL